MHSHKLCIATNSHLKLNTQRTRRIFAHLPRSVTVIIRYGLRRVSRENCRISLGRTAKKMPPYCVSLKFCALFAFNFRFLIKILFTLREQRVFYVTLVKAAFYRKGCELMETYVPHWKCLNQTYTPFHKLSPQECKSHEGVGICVQL